MECKCHTAGRNPIPPGRRAEAESRRAGAKAKAADRCSVSVFARQVAPCFGLKVAASCRQVLSRREPFFLSKNTPPAGLSVETKDAPFGKGFDFRFKSDTSTTTISIDPLGMHHTDSGSISSKAGSISLSAKYSTTDRTIEIVAKRGGSEIGTFSWHVESVLR